MIDFAKRILADENGTTAIEFGICAALAATAGVASLLAMGSSVEAFFTGAASVEGFAIADTDGGGLRG